MDEFKRHLDLDKKFFFLLFSVLVFSNNIVFTRIMVLHDRVLLTGETISGS